MPVVNFDIERLDVRQAVKSDASDLALLVAEPGFDYPTDESLVRERLIDLIAAGDLILVATYNTEIIGMMRLHRTRFLHRKPDGRISAFVVSEAYRGHNVGARLIQEAESVFSGWGCARIEVSSGLRLEGAHRFYQRMGFTEQPKRFIKIIAESLF